MKQSFIKIGGELFPISDFLFYGGGKEAVHLKNDGTSTLYSEGQWSYVEQKVKVNSIKWEDYLLNVKQKDSIWQWCRVNFVYDGPYENKPVDRMKFILTYNESKGIASSDYENIDDTIGCIIYEDIVQKYKHYLQKDCHAVIENRMELDEFGVSTENLIEKIRYSLDYQKKFNEFVLKHTQND